MSTDELKSHPIADLLKVERRKELVPNLVFAKGVTTVVTPSGGGKTTLCFCMGLYVSAAQWGQEEVEQRPLLWILGEDQDGLRAIFEAWTEHNPNLCPDARFMNEMVDFANRDQVRWLIKHIHDYFERPPVIMADALSDILAVQGLDEDKSKEVAKVYKGIWQVVNETSAAVVVLHHSGWDEKRERGSSTIRQKSDIVVKIVSFDPEAGVVRLEHLKRRTGPKLKEFYLEAKMIAVNGYPAIPIVTGPKDEAPETGDQTADAVHARSLVTLVVQHFPNGAIRADLERQSGMKASTFYRAHSYAVENGWLVKRDKLYNLNPTAPWDRTPLETPSPLPPTFTSNLHPYRGVEADEGKLGTSTGGELEVSWRLKARESGEKADTTASAEKLNEIKEGERSTPNHSVVPSDEESDLIVDALEQIKQRTA